MRPPSSSRSRPLPALRPRRRAAEHRDRAFERGALRRDGACVVPRIRLLLVRRIVLLVDADQAEPAHRREDRRPCADDDARLAARDAKSLVAPLGLGQPGVEQCDARRRSARGSDRPPAASARSPGRARSSRSRARALRRTPGGTPRSSRCPSRRGAGSCRRDRRRAHRRPPRRALVLRVREPSRLGLALERLALARLRALAARLALNGSDERERASRSRAVVVGDPERELDERLRQLLDDALDRRDVDAGGRVDAELDDEAAALRVAEAHLDDRADPRRRPAPRM